MTTKDLNLSFDRGLLRPTETHSQTTKSGNTRQVEAAIETRLPKNRVPRRTAPQKKLSWQGITIIGIAITNMLFLVLAGIWLSERSGGLPPQLATRHSDITPQLEVMQARIEQQIDSIEQQLENLQIAINGQQHLIVSAYQDIGLRMHEGKPAAEAPQDTAPPSPAPNQEAPKPGEAEAHTGWYINLGSFPTKAAAFEIQEQFQAFGYAAQIHTLTIDNQAAYAVILPNFEDQASAETAVNQLLDRTDLDGLTVWKEK